MDRNRQSGHRRRPRARARRQRGGHRTRRCAPPKRPSPHGRRGHSGSAATYSASSAAPCASAPRRSCPRGRGHRQHDRAAWARDVEVGRQLPRVLLRLRHRAEGRERAGLEPTGMHFSHPRALRRGRAHRAVQSSVPVRRRAPGGAADGGQHGDHQDAGDESAVRHAHGRDLPRTCCRPASSTSCTAPGLPTGDALVRHPRIWRIGFTGSVQTGHRDPALGGRSRP